MQAYEVGREVYWRHVPRGGYGFAQRVPAVVREVSASGKRVLIEAQLARGGSRLTYVKPESLEAREEIKTSV